MTATASDSARRKLTLPWPPRTPSEVQRTFSAMEHARVWSYNGRPACPHCDAYDTWTYEAPGAWHATTHHDEWCPLWTYILNK